MAQTTQSIPSTADFKYPPSSLHTCIYCKRIVIDPSTPDAVHDRHHATFINSFKFEYAEVVKAGHGGCILLLPVLEAIQGSHNPSQDTSQSSSKLLAGTIFIDIHIKYQQARETYSESAKDICDAEIWWRQTDRNICPDQGSPILIPGAYHISAELGKSEHFLNEGQNQVSLGNKADNNQMMWLPSILVNDPNTRG
jgi:hypothetical protein